MPTLELFKGSDRVIVEIKTPQEEYWRGQGYVPKGEKPKVSKSVVEKEVIENGQEVQQETPEEVTSDVLDFEDDEVVKPTRKYTRRKTVEGE